MIRIEYATMQAALACRADRAEIRKYFNGVLIDTAGNIVSTNGHVMFVGKVTGDAPSAAMLFSMFLKPPAKYDFATVEADHVKFWSKDQFVTVPIEPLNNFPQWERLVKSFKNDTTAVLGLNGKYLRLIGKIAKWFGDTALLETGLDNVSVMRWTLKRVEDKKTFESAHVYLMPCRV